MPLPERVIQPVNVSRGTLQYQVPDELEGVTNGTLSNIIRQLSSLSRHAEEIFGHLFEDAESIAVRSSNLQAKIDRLAIRVTQLDSTVEEVSLQDIQLRKAYRTTQSFDQQVVARETMPKAMLEVYLSCDKPPPLHKLNPYRDDGKDGLKFYTDSTYFFELWRQEMLKDTEKMMHDKGKKHPGKLESGNGGPKSKKRPQNTSEKQREKAIGRGEYILQTDHYDSGHQRRQLNNMYPEEMYSMDPYPDLHDFVRPNSIEVKRSGDSQKQQLHQIRQHELSQQRQQQQQLLQQQQFGSSQVGNSPYLQQQQESIYTPRVLLASNQDQPSSPRYYGSSQSYSVTSNPESVQSNLPYGDRRQQFDLNLAVEQIELIGQNRDSSPMSSEAGTPSRGGQRRPSQPPPAPPPISSNAGTPTRATSAQRDNLSEPPTSETQNGYSSQQIIVGELSPSHKQPQNNGADSDLPPLQIDTNSKSLAVKIPVEHLPPSPPPPPPTEPPLAPPFNAAPPAPPPPPPPPPSDSLVFNGSRMTNGDLHSNATTKVGSPLTTDLSSPVKSILSPVGLKKPAEVTKQDNVRSDLLKAIRDGIALKKVEEREKAKSEKEATANGQSDVASILARRVAVEMSDSDEPGAGNSDSEYDSGDWDESTA